MDGNQEDSDSPRTYYWDNNVNFPDNVYLHPNVGNDTIAPYVMNAILKSTVNYTFSYGFQFMEDDKVSVSVISTTPCNVSLQTFPPKGYTLYLLDELK